MLGGAIGMINNEVDSSEEAPSGSEPHWRSSLTARSADFYEMRTTRLSQPAAGRGSCRRAAGLFARGLAVHEAPGLLLRSGCARASGTASVVKEREAGGLGALPAQTGSRETAHVGCKSLSLALKPADLFDSNPCVLPRTVIGELMLT